MARAKMPRKASKKRVEAALEALATVRRDWHRRPGVTAVDVGYKIRDKEITNEVALRMHVKRKLPPKALPAHELVSSSDQPKKVGDFPIDVLEADYAPADLGPQMIEAAEDVNRRRRVDPLVAGVSVGNQRITAGTLGAIVWDREDGEACILSNWHVLCGDPACVAGETIVQPGPLDGGRPQDKVAELKRFRLDSGADAALARLTGERESSRDVLGLAPIPGIDSPALGMLVSKSGRTTGNTEGMIDGVGLSTAINYGGGVVQSFSQQIHIVPRPPWPNVDYELSKGGDSGSVWINDATGNAVGLHFAGESDPAPIAENAIANRMEVVADELNFQFTPVFRPPPPPADDDLRDLIRRIICARFPFLCFGFFPMGPQAASAQAAAPSSCGCGGGAQQAQQAGYGGGMDPGAVEAMIEQIVAEVRRSR